MPIDDPMVQRGIYAIGLPIVAAVLLVGVAGIAVMVAWSGKGGRRFSAWVVPIAAAAGVGLALVQPFHATPEPGAIGGDWLQWKWLVPAMLAILLLWPAALMLWPEARGRRWFWAAWTAIALAVAGGVLVGLTRYDMQSTRYLYVVPAALAVLGLLLYPPAVRDAGTKDLFAVTLAGGIAVPILGLTEFHTVAMLVAPVIVVAAVAAVFAVVFRGDRFGDLRHGLAAGAMVVPLVLPPAAMVAWFNAYGLGPIYAVALALLPVAAVAGVWTARLPRVMPAIITTLFALVALGLVLTQVDLSPYLIETQGLPENTPTTPTTPTTDSSEVDYWSSDTANE